MVRDDTAPKGWTGLNIDLFDQLAELCGFTYEIRDMGFPEEGRTWTEHMIQEMWHADLTGYARVDEGLAEG